MLQNGIYYDGGMPNAFRLLQLNFVDGICAHVAKESLYSLWEMLVYLARGELRDLRKELRDDDPVEILSTGDLQVLIGYGTRFFDSGLHNPQLTIPENQPRRLQYLRAGNDNSPFQKLRWRKPHDPCLQPSHPLTTQSDIAFQFTANTELAVNRAIVEVSKLIYDERLPLTITNFFSGFKREDRRSWIDFHDGINNMSPKERKIAIEVVGADREWIVGGTYMSFFQIHVNLERWRVLPRHMQELIVGRNKISGHPVTRSILSDDDSQLYPEFSQGCPASNQFIDPSQPIDYVVRASHIHRANLNRGSPSQGANNRVYRQGYEFLRPDPTGGLLHGLNFVAFHRSVKFVTDILRQRFWMGDVNFGGVPVDDPKYPAPVKLMELLHGAYYAVPPTGDLFPGQHLFEN